MAETIGFTTPTIVRESDGKLFFVGDQTDPRRELVALANAGHFSQAVIDGLDDLPVFDKSLVEGEPIIIVVCDKAVSVGF